MRPARGTKLPPLSIIIFFISQRSFCQISRLAWNRANLANLRLILFFHNVAGKDNAPE
jgi:hypothetical protein